LKTIWDYKFAFLSTLIFVPTMIFISIYAIVSIFVLLYFGRDGGIFEGIGVFLTN